MPLEAPGRGFDDAEFVARTGNAQIAGQRVRVAHETSGTAHAW